MGKFAFKNIQKIELKLFFLFKINKQGRSAHQIKNMCTVSTTVCLRKSLMLVFRVTPTFSTCFY